MIRAAEVRDTEFPLAARFRRGYVATEVDAFMERIATRLETGRGVTSNDVYHVAFARAALAERGYAEQGVDAFLDRIHAELLRLEDAWGHRQSTAPDDLPDSTGSQSSGSPGWSDPAGADEVHDGDPDTLAGR